MFSKKFFNNFIKIQYTGRKPWILENHKDFPCEEFLNFYNSIDQSITNLVRQINITEELGYAWKDHARKVENKLSEKKGMKL